MGPANRPDGSWTVFSKMRERLVWAHPPRRARKSAADSARAWPWHHPTRCDRFHVFTNWQEAEVRSGIFRQLCSQCARVVVASSLDRTKVSFSRSHWIPHPNVQKLNASLPDPADMDEPRSGGYCCALHPQVMGELSLSTTQKRLSKEEGQWGLEVERMVPLGRYLCRPVPQTIARQDLSARHIRDVPDLSPMADTTKHLMSEEASAGCYVIWRGNSSVSDHAHRRGRRPDGAQEQD